MSQNNDAKDDDEKSCCTWPKIVLLAVGVIVGGILIWKFAPIDEAINSVLPTFNNTGSGYFGGGGGSILSPPTQAPTDLQYEFMQCQDPTRNCCNGLDTICDLGVDDILYASVHNAMATFEDGFLFGPNHRLRLEGALEAGYRGINLDVCNCNGVYQFCHGICNVGSRDIKEVFTSINNFLDDNPTEVLVIPLQFNNDVDEVVDIWTLYNITNEVRGFTDKFYVHDNLIADWPTLREVIDSNKRVLMFHYKGPECSQIGECPAGMHFYWNYATNTKWSFKTVAELRATSTSCQFQYTPRIAGKTFFGVNSFVTPPDQNAARTANSYDFAKLRLETCSETNENLDVNFIYADYWSEGDLPRLTQEHNAALASRRGRKLMRGSNN